MFDLIAQDKTSQNRWRRRIPEDIEVAVGRTTSPLGTPWDSQISRRHFTLLKKGTRVLIQKIPEAANPIFFRGREVARFFVSNHEHFVIGQTLFTVVDSEVRMTQDVPKPLRQRNFTFQYLDQLHYRDAQQRLTILGQLPKLIANAVTDAQLHDALAQVLLDGVSRATTVAIIEWNRGQGEPRVVHWDGRHELSVGFQPSESLIRQAFETEQTTLHIWSTSPVTSSRYTVEQNSDWAFACPLPTTGWQRQAIYVAGQYESLSEQVIQDELQDDMKFVQLAGSTYTNLIELNRLQRRQAGLRSFFSPIVLEAISGQDPEEILRPRECHVSVLFCDLRGFSAVSERMSDHLLELLQGVSESLGIMTSSILDHKGVVGDFHGDAVMGFWGWPLEQPDAASRAVQTAVAIARKFDEIREAKSLPVSELITGLGIASGPAVAGKIGSSDQVKVTAFGPVVNLAARLESMTRSFRVPILIDQTTAQSIQEEQADLGVRVRRLGWVLPSGFQKRVSLFQVLPNSGAYLDISDGDLQKYEDAAQLFQTGQWTTALEKLRQLPEVDFAKRVMEQQIERQPQGPPNDWNQVLEVRSK